MAAVLAGAGLVILVLTGTWRKLPVLLLLCGLAWAGGCSLLRGTLWRDLYAYVPAACAMLFCFSAALIQDEQGLKRMIAAVCSLWIAWMTILSLAALYAAFTGTHLHQTSNARFIGINAGDNRLYIMDFCTNAAGNLLTAILMAAGCLLTAKKTWQKAVLTIALLPLLAALSLTDARTSFIAVGVGFGAMAACLIFRDVKCGGGALRYFIALAAAAVVMVISYLALTFLTNTLGAFVPGYTSAILPAALADGGTVVHRTIGSGSLLTYRDDVWRGFFAFLKAEPGTLFTGTGPASLMERVMPFVVSAQAVFDHPHCMYLHVLGSYGIPGFLLMVLFLALFARRSWQLIFSDHAPLWRRLLPIPAIAVLVCELVECLTMGRVNGPILILLFLCFGAVFAPLEEAAGEENT